MQRHWGAVDWRRENANNLVKKEAILLKLNCDKALHLLNWKPTLTFESTVEMTANWYKRFYEKSEKTNDLTYRQIIQYTQIAENKNIEWVN